MAEGETIKMRCNLKGLLRNATTNTKRQQMRMYEGVVEEVIKNLEEMAQRFYAGDTTGVDEFCDLYCLKPKGGK